MYSLLGDKQVQKFIATPEYAAHKEARFPKKDFDIPIKENQAFLLSDPILRAEFVKRYKSTSALYYNGQPDFDRLFARIKDYVKVL